MIETYVNKFNHPCVHLLPGADDNSRERKSQAFHLLQIPHTRATHMPHTHTMYTQTLSQSMRSANAHPGQEGTLLHSKKKNHLSLAENGRKAWINVGSFFLFNFKHFLRIQTCPCSHGRRLQYWPNIH